jgi:hypothetical protein
MRSALRRLQRITEALDYAECANDICQGDNNCPICGSQLDGSNVSVEVIGDSSVLRSLRGSSPEEIIMVLFPLSVVPEYNCMKKVAVLAAPLHWLSGGV